MAAILGINSSIGIAISAVSDSWGTAKSVTEKLVVESMSWNENPEKLESAGIGSGGLMSDNMQRGAISVSGQIQMRVGYGNGFPLILAQFLGTSGTPSEQNVGEGDYLHTMTMNSTLNNVFLTIAVETSSTTVVEFPSVAVTQIQISADSAPNYVNATIDFLASEAKTSGVTNNNAALDALTLTDTELSLIDPADSFQINAQAGGALSGSDKLDITSYSLTLNRPQEFAREIRGASGNGEPIQTDKVTGSLAINLKQLDDNTYLTAAQSSTEYKCLLSFDGSQIASGDNKSFTFYVPRMMLIETPSYELSSPGLNGYGINFDILEAASNPTGMGDTTPYNELTNTRTTAYVA
jgi:hypothetical protein